MIFDLRRRVPLAVSRQLNTNTLLLGAARDHFDIVDLLRARDLPALSALMRRHVVATPAVTGR